MGSVTPLAEDELDWVGGWHWRRSGPLLLWSRSYKKQAAAGLLFCVLHASPKTKVRARV